MLGLLGNILVWAAFGTSIAAAVAYFMSINDDSPRVYNVANYLFGLKGALVLAASGVLIYLILTHQFQYYYVFNYTSKDLALKYLVSAFYGGQEGSFMLWILFSALVGLGLIKWTTDPYKKPVMFVMTVTQVFLLSMIAGIDLGSIHLGASPFRTLAEEMPNAPFLQSNPDFVPNDGSGLNDLLKSPWMMIHPPILFLGFSMMTVPFAFSMAALWKRKYQEWVTPAMPWTLGANVCLLTAIFLGGYWAYVTLSFGGYWAWDPVENASLVPWLFGTAGIHAMLIQRKSSTSQKASIVFAILAYVAIVYETFLTRSGILSDASVHSFVDLGLYNQLLLFMLATVVFGFGLFFYRYKELPKQNNEVKLLSREFMTFAGSMILFLMGLVIILGTSSPILGKLFVSNPTPPEISYYNGWTMPLAIVAAVFTVLGQFLFWKRHDAESLSSALLLPLTITSVVAITTIIWADIRSLYYMVYTFTGWFAVIGNTTVMINLLRKKPKLLGGTVSHAGFAVLLLGILASSVYNEHLLDQQTAAYNKAIERGDVTDEKGFPVTQKVEMLELKLNEPVLVNNEYLVTYQGYDVHNQDRKGQQTYKLKFEDPDGEWDPFYMNPQVYPMMASSSAENIQWSVDPAVRTGILNDIYLYVAGSSYVERKNNQVKQQQSVQPAAAQGGMPQEHPSVGGAESDTSKAETVTLGRGQTIEIGSYRITFNDFAQVDSTEIPQNTKVAVRAHLEVNNKASDHTQSIHPMFAVITQEGDSWSVSPPVELTEWGISVQFTNIDPSSGNINLMLEGIDGSIKEKEWVLVVAEEKPFISIVWLGTFMLMGGFSIAIFRRWAEQKQREKQLKS